ncbi:glycoside hydrolase [Lacinutrix sp. C3R15]|nr:glycoside hydrolase [Lacinutrix sp. C3R15]
MSPIRKEKINGVSFVASRTLVKDTHIAPVVNIHANYAAIMPFGFIQELQDPEVVYNKNRQWFGETVLGAKQYIEALQKKNIKIMLKPQIWVRKGEFTGYIKMQNEEDWKRLETSYTRFILDYAALAEETKAEILCIGTELEQFVINRPDFWKQLIVEIRKVYKGKLTYAANWDEFKRTPFWSDLDFIGIDAYFPVSEEKTPSLESCLEGWKPHVATIEFFYKNYKKPILFTEFGYRSVDYAAKEPWRSDRSMTSVNLEAQTNTTQALLQTFWKEDWFAGGFIWKWFHNHHEVGGETNNRFTPQNKPVEKVIKEVYKAF